jgi:hypothetical protein
MYGLWKTLPEEGEHGDTVAPAARAAEPQPSIALANTMQPKIVGPLPGSRAELVFMPDELPGLRRLRPSNAVATSGL